jgi:hypothetical protein
MMLMMLALVGCTSATASSGSAPTQARPDGSPAAVRADLQFDKQLAELVGADTVPGDNFGFSVAVSGSTAVVGAPFHANNAGRAYVFTDAHGAWTQTAELVGSGTVSGDDFGCSVAVSGSTVVVGAPGSPVAPAGRAYVFTDAHGAWTQTAELVGSDTVSGDSFGFAVAVSGSTVVVGAPGGAGKAYVFTERVRTWTQVAELVGPEVADDFGYSVAVSGSTVVIGSFGYGKLAGRAYVFTESKGVWAHSAELVGSDTVSGDSFGFAVAVSGSTVVVGGDTHSKGAGRAYVFTESKGTWAQTAEMVGSDTVSEDAFGASVAVSGSTVVISAFGHAKRGGRAYVFTESKGAWAQVAEMAGSATAAVGYSGYSVDFGYSVAVSGTMALVGAPVHAHGAGRVYVFKT